MGIVIAFDIGDKRIGVAVSDPGQSFAIPSDTYFRTGNFSEDVEACAKIASRQGAVRIVCGLPLSEDGSESVQSGKARRFAEALGKATGQKEEAHRFACGGLHFGKLSFEYKE